jgi:quinol monooxygenase YgiN
MSKTIVLVSYRAQPDHVAEALASIGTLIAKVQEVEANCGGITMLQDSNDPTHINLIEHWPSQEEFLGPHMQQPHIQQFIRDASAFLAGPPEITFWQPVGVT